MMKPSGIKVEKLEAKFRLNKFGSLIPIKLYSSYQDKIGLPSIARSPSPPLRSSIHT